jgi:hypothetical protein
MHPHRLDSGEEFEASSHSLAGSMLRERCQAPRKLPASEPRLDRRSRVHSETRSNSPPEPSECLDVPCHPLVQSLAMTLHRKGGGMEIVAARVVTASTVPVPCNAPSVRRHDNPSHSVRKHLPQEADKHVRGVLTGGAMISPEMQGKLANRSDFPLVSATLNRRENLPATDLERSRLREEGHDRI